MKLNALKNKFRETLNQLFDISEIDNFFFLSLEKVESKTRMDFLLNQDFEISKENYNIWENILQDLFQEKPIQYILNEAHFYGLVFYVEEGVLIPRPETEELVDWILQTALTQETIKILDIGTGSGCIAISLANNLPNAQVFAMDISDKALEIASENAKINDVKVNFIKQDILNLEELGTQFDIIVSNPPYVRDMEKVEIHNNVKNFEPHLALFVSDNNPLIFYKKIVELASNSLLPNGYLFFEINQYLGAETLDLFNNYSFDNKELKKDFMQNDRMIRAQLSKV